MRRTNEETGNYGRGGRGVTLAKINADPRIDEAYGDGDGWWLHIKYGFADMDEDPCEPRHVIREDTVTALARHLRSIEPCDCRECVKYTGRVQ